MTLYRKYRPKRFSELVGRGVISEILTGQIRSGKIASAYLFSGARGTGKTTIARIFAKSLNCPNRDSKTCDPCNQCPSCVAINEGRSQDLIEIDAASNRGIDEIRQLREHVKYVPSNSPYKVYVIDEAHMLTKEASNALLKTLEEPPSRIVFILATTELHKILGTIFSRCQHFNFSKLAVSDILSRLSFLAKEEQIKIDNEVALDIARRSGGSLRDAESLLGQIFSIGLKKITLKDVEIFLPKIGFSKTTPWISSLILGKADDSFEMLREIEEGGVNLVFFIEEALESARQMMIYSVIRDERRLFERFTLEEIDVIKDILKDSNPQRLRRIVVELLRAFQDMRAYPEIPSLPIEIAIVLICSEYESDELKKAQNKNKNTELENSLSEQKPIAIDPSKPFHSLEEVLDGWGEVLAKVKDSNHALNFVLGVARPVGVEGNRIEIGFKYRLQQEKILELKNRQIVENIIKEVYGVDYCIDPVLKEDIELKYFSKDVDQKEDDEFVKTALEVFEGAEVIS